MRNIKVIILILSCLLLMFCHNDVSKDSPKIVFYKQNNNDQENDTQNNKNNNNSENNETLDNNSYMKSLKGTIWYADDGSFLQIFIIGYSNKILFQVHQNGDRPGGLVTFGDFPISSYDGKTMKLLDYDNLEVAFSVIVSDNKMIVDGLKKIKTSLHPDIIYNYASYNGTYTKGKTYQEVKNYEKSPDKRF